MDLIRKEVLKVLHPDKVGKLPEPIQSFYNSLFEANKAFLDQTVAQHTEESKLKIHGDSHYAKS